MFPYEDPLNLHAPIPLHTYTFPSSAPSSSSSSSSSSSETLLYPCIDTPHAGISPLEYYPTQTQLLFPTPSELLCSTRPLLDSLQLTAPLALPQPTSTSTPTPAPASTPASPSVHLPTADVPPPKTETQRKARQRAVAEEIGFTPTDPDTISSHEKKRHYLECLEHYVLYLHEQLRLVRTAPLALERVSTYRGLSSRSIRTLLVHMQNINRSLHDCILAEEQVFLELSSEVVAAHNAGLPLRRHSVDVVGWPGSVTFAGETRWEEQT